MKTTFKTCLVAIALLIGVNTYAQDKPLTFGIKGGVNLSNFSGASAKGMDARVSFNVGLTVDYALTQDLYLLTGLEYIVKGAKDEGTMSVEDPTYGKISFTGTENDSPTYLQVPIHLGYKLVVTDAAKIVFRAGPYIAYGIGGEVEVEGKAVINDVTVDIDGGYDFFEEGRAKRFDFGLGLGVGAEFGKIGVGLGYDLGLINIADTDLIDGNIKNMNAYLTVGYKF